MRFKKRNQKEYPVPNKLKMFYFQQYIVDQIYRGKAPCIGWSSSIILLSPGKPIPYRKTVAEE